MPLRFDATMKDIVADHPADYAAAFGMQSAGPVAALNVDLSTISAATDVAIGFGKPIREIVDLNFQSGPDSNLPSRLHIYNAVLNSRYRVPVRSIAILLRAKADTASLTGKLAYGSGVSSRIRIRDRSAVAATRRTVFGGRCIATPALFALSCAG